MDCSKIIKELGKDRVRLDEPMARHTTFRIGGPADLFYEAKNEEELIGVIRLVRGIGVPYFLLGGGSNILVSDKGIRGIVIQIKNEKLKIKNGNGKSKIFADAGVFLPRLIKFAEGYSLSGLEFLVGIPGTVGGAIMGNVGTATEWINQRLESVKILNSQGKLRTLKVKDCQFGYRDSRFKRTKETILEATLRCGKGQKQEIVDRIKKYSERRRDQPTHPSSGCIFKNPKDGSAGRLIDQCGLKGKKIGGAQISEKHANFIINLGGATCQDVLKLIALIKKNVKGKFGIELEEEIEIVGEF